MRRPLSLPALPALLLTLLPSTSAIELDLASHASIVHAASTVAHGMMQWYPGNETGQVPGLLPLPYYWWEAGAMLGSLIDYWYYTGDETYNDIVMQGMLFQVGPDDDFMPPNQTKDEGNDDQVFWGFSAMSAAEYNFPNPPPDQPQWLALAQGVWNSQVLRWDKTSCGGGLRWQIFEFNNGYDYKNSPSNAGFLNLGARLYAYTSNQTYADWVVTTWDWMVDMGLIGGPSHWTVYDGTGTIENCTNIDPYQWSYSPAMLINGAAMMWNKTGDPIWAERVMGLWNSTDVFFKQKVMYEAACEPRGNCDTDQLSFKAYFSRFMAASVKVMPSLYDVFHPYFETSSLAAAAQCTGTIDGIYNAACGTRWYEGHWDGTYGIGQQMCAMEIILTNLIQQSRTPVTHESGGTSTGDPSAGTQGDDSSAVVAPLSQVTTADKAGAGTLTACVLVIMLGGAWWMVI